MVQYLAEPRIQVGLDGWPTDDNHPALYANYRMPRQ